VSSEMKIQVINGAKVIDGTGSDPIDKGIIIIEGSKIKAVGKNLTIPRGADLIDATGKIVMPGMIDSHMHNMGIKAVEEKRPRPKELNLIKSIDDSRAVIAAGFTTIKDCGGKNSIFLKQAVAEGTLSGLPRIVAAGLLVVQTSNGLDNPYLPEDCLDARLSDQSDFLLCDGVDECIKGTRYALRYGADFIKIFASGNAMLERSPMSDLHFTMDEIRAIVLVAAQLGKYVSAHCHNSASAKNAILSGARTIDHAIGADEEVIALAKKHNVVFVSTLTPFRPESNSETGLVSQGTAKYQSAWEAMVNTYKMIRKNGAILAVGTDLNSAPISPLGVNAIELELLVKYCDFSPMEAIVAATRNGAMACFMGDKTGTIQPGRLADIIIVDGDPLTDIKVLQHVEKIKMVMLEGKIEINRGLFISTVKN
jgi:imidazolonepropionase-like amidohydrolase